MTYPPIESFQPVTTIQPWGTETLIASTPQYTGKVLCYKAGQAGGFQYHVEKDETFYLYSGFAHIGWVEDSRIKTAFMYPGESHHIPAGAPHRFKAIDDCIVFEVSTPHKHDRVNVSEEFGLPDPPGTLPSTWVRELDGTHLRLPDA